MNEKGYLSTEKLENSLCNTIFGKHIKDVDSHLLNILSSDGENFAIPTLDFFLSDKEDIKAELVALYNGTMGNERYVNDVPDDIKAAQAALFDSLCFGYDFSKDSMDLYTLNTFILGQEPEEVDTKKVISFNREGKLRCYRVDIEYMGSPNNFAYKLVNHRKIVDNYENVVLIPYVIVLRLMKMFENLINTNGVFLTKQDVNGQEKIRCITRNMEVFNKYCDSQVSQDILEPSYFPLKGFFYAPVLGAPSISSMVTNIKFTNLTQFSRVRSTSEVAEYGIVPCRDGIKTFITNLFVARKLLEIKEDSLFKFASTIESFPELRKLESRENLEDCSSTIINNYFRSISEESKTVVVEKLGIKEDIEKYSNMFSKCRNMSANELSDLRNVLKENVCKFIIRKSDCTLSSIICTNNKEKLAIFYGEDYFGKYESLGVRCREAYNLYKSGHTLQGSLLKMKIDVDPHEVSEVLENEDAFVKKIYEVKGIRKRASSSTDNIMVRTIDAYSSSDYYRYLDESKILNAMIMG